MAEKRGVHLARPRRRLRSLSGSRAFRQQQLLPSLLPRRSPLRAAEVARLPASCSSSQAHRSGLRPPV